MSTTYTNTGLVKHAQAALKLKTKYMWGGILRLIEKQYDLLMSIYGINPDIGYTKERWNELAQLKYKDVYAVDCVGLIKSYYWSGNPNGGVGSKMYCSDEYPDVSAVTMFEKAKNKGPISTLPERPGVIVFCKSHPHVGIYIGNGYTIESTLGSRGDGVVKRKLDSLWEYWFECPYISYAAETTTTAKTKKCTLAFPAKVRSEPKLSASQLGRLTAGATVTIIIGSETKDTVSGNEYVRLSGEAERWIVKSAIK